MRKNSETAENRRMRRTDSLAVIGALCVSVAEPLFGLGKSPMKTSLKLLYPLDEFYAQARQALPAVVKIEAKEVPEPYRQLLVHDTDMTPTLEKFHGGPISIRILKKRQQGDEYARQVALTLNGTEKPVEFGAIVIHLQRFPAAARQQILEGKRPLGTILATHSIEHKSRPLAYIRVTSDEVINGALKLNGQHELYGRRNVLLDAQGRALADVVEILPPINRS